MDNARVTLSAPKHPAEFSWLAQGKFNAEIFLSQAFARRFAEVAENLFAALKPTLSLSGKTCPLIENNFLEGHCEMNANGLPIIGLLQQKMSWLNDRQTILARNIANASTPGFVPQDLRANDFAATLAGSQSGLQTTNALHIQPRSMLSQSHQAMSSPDSQSSPDGNAVVVEEQMLKVSETQISYAQASGLYKKMTGMWRLALSGGQ